jgi:parvulin-like peptidyl-prolyl isomerase
MAKSSRKPQAASTRRSSQRRPEPSEAERQTKKQIAMGRKHARQNRIILLSLAGLGAIIVLILAVGLLQELVMKPSRPVATVNGQDIAAKDYWALLQYQRYTLHRNITELDAALQTIDPTQEGSEFLISFYEQQVQQLEGSLSLVPQNTLDQLIDYALIQEKADEIGVTVTAAEVEQTINQQIRDVLSGASTTITGTEELATPVPEKDVQDYYNNLLEGYGLSAKEFEGIVHRDLLSTKVEEYLADQLPTTGLVAHVQLVEAGSQDEAVAAQGRIESGEDFALVAQEVSTDTVTAETGGDLGWVTPDQLSSRYGQALADQAFALELGAVGVVADSETFYVVQVVERDENGPLPEDVINSQRSAALTNWLAERNESPDVEIERLLEPDQIPPDPFGTL